MDRARLEKAYQGVDFVRRSLLEVRKRLESQKADVVAHYGENTPLSISYDRDMMKVDELVKTIGEYLGTCDDWKIMNLLYDIMMDEKSLLDERFTETLKPGKERGILKRIEKNWKIIRKMEEKKKKAK